MSIRSMIRASADPVDGARKAPEWIKDARERRHLVLIAGQHSDIVQMDFALARIVLERLRDSGCPVGPCLINRAARASWWLLPLGTGYQLSGTKGVQLLDAGHKLTAPLPGAYDPDRLWSSPPGGARRPVRPEELRFALAAAQRACRTDPYTTPECRLGQHGRCPGNTDIRRIGAPEHEPPVQRLRCDCDCGHPS
ncbi:hypothetical protein [Streptomyces orinoci]|uniref:Uncharacterized protein n=1 Tax=Streptomyces orinoci TaxID=67339 RepID=A0ABV3K621_STRON|nr:hypothetical protein [Streptomyces orinoci]